MHKNLMEPIKLDLKKKISRFYPQKRNRISTLESKSVLRNSNIFIGIFPFPPKNCHKLESIYDTIFLIKS